MRTVSHPTLNVLGKDFLPLLCNVVFCYMIRNLITGEYNKEVVSTIKSKNADFNKNGY